MLFVDQNINNTIQGKLDNLFNFFLINIAFPGDLNRQVVLCDRHASLRIHLPTIKRSKSYQKPYKFLDPKLVAHPHTESEDATQT